MLKNNCIFCKIVNGEAPADFLFSDETVTAFRDIHPIAPVHILIVPNHHIESINDIQTRDEQIFGHLINVAKQIAFSEGLDQRGYRLVFNTGPEAGQSVFHVHLHLIGGRYLPFNFR